MIIKHHDVLVFFSSNAMKIKYQAINNWLVCTPTCFQAKSPKGKMGISAFYVGLLLKEHIIFMGYLWTI